MDITPQDDTTTQPISDDQELAKALAGVSMDEPEEPVEAADEDTPAVAVSSTAVPSIPVMGADSATPVVPTVPEAPAVPSPTSLGSFAPNDSSLPTPSVGPSVAGAAGAFAGTMGGATGSFGDSSSASTSGASGATDLSSIKGAAIQQLRPLMDHVDLPPEEKFDTYLMLIRSTDDSSLIEPAHAAAQGITDEKRKAEALLEIIREIDYLSKKSA